MILSMCGLRFQSVVDVVALPAGFLVVDLHVERQGEFAASENRIEITGERLENMFAGLLAGDEVAAFAQAQHHIEESEMGLAIGDGELLAADGADANAAERENSGLHRGLAHDFHDLSHVNPPIEVGGILQCEMRHAGSCYSSGPSSEITTDR